MAAEVGRPVSPKTILRGHRVQVHAAVFCRGNERLITGDADGFVVAWDLITMRPRAVWQAHDKALLGMAAWGRERIITHGRDNRLVVWRLGAEHEASMSTSLPLTPEVEPRPKPWMLHMLEVNTMNFCAFSSCAPPGGQEDGDDDGQSSELLVAVPNTLASEAVDIFHLPSQRRIHTAKLGDKNGMVMALALFPRGGMLTLAAAYENGLATVASLDNDGSWAVTYRATCHAQPVLSLDVDPTNSFFLTSGADDVISKHPIPVLTHSEAPTPLRSVAEGEGETRPTKSLLSGMLSSTSTVPMTTPTRAIRTDPLQTLHTRHSGQQGLRIRSDGKVFATAGWDAKVRVYSAKTLKEVAVLKWHQVGCYAAAFADVSGEGNSSTSPAGQDSEAVDVPKLVEVTLRDKRVIEARTAHWLAAGAKDGKVSLWQVF